MLLALWFVHNFDRCFTFSLFLTDGMQIAELVKHPRYYCLLQCYLSVKATKMRKYLWFKPRKIIHKPKVAND